MKYTIIIPTHNRPLKLQRLLKSLNKLEQSEVIVVENGSSDIMLQKYRGADLASGQRIIYNDVKGVSSARNKGIELSSGKYLFFIDDDDCVPIEFVRFLNDFNPTKSVYRFPHEFDNGKKVKPFLPSFLRNIDHAWTVQVSSFLISKQHIDKIGYKFNENTMPEDIEFAAVMMNSVRGIGKMKYINICSITRTTPKSGNLSDNISTSERINSLNIFLKSINGKNKFMNSICYSHIYEIIHYNNPTEEDKKTLAKYVKKFGKTGFNNNYRVRRVRKFLHNNLCG